MRHAALILACTPLLAACSLINSFSIGPEIDGGDQLDGGRDAGSDAGPEDSGSDAGSDACTERAFFADSDRDGFGDPEVSRMVCEMPDGFVDNDDDCDDSCEICQPGGTEICDSSRDEDCDGTIDESATCVPCGGTCDWACSRALCDDAIAVTAGTNHSCAILEQGGVACWGNNADGQLGTGIAGPGLRSAVPVRVVDMDGTGYLAGVTSLSGGEGHTCAVVTGGEVWCWGRGGLGQLGDGRMMNSPRPVRVTGIAGATQVSAGPGFTCALLSTGRVMCWGKNNNGNLGDGSTTMRTTPVAAGTISTATEIAVGGSHACALLADGTARCWGANSAGQLGDGSTTQRDRPATVLSLSGATQIATRWNHTCARTGSGTVLCWGANGWGQLRGDGSTGDVNEPTTVPGVTAEEIRTGTNFTCARLVDRSAECWGSSYYGQLGNGSTSAILDAIARMPVVGLADTEELALGWEHACARRTGGTLSCWGRNSYGQLGTGDEMQRTAPADVVPPPPL